MKTTQWTGLSPMLWEMILIYFNMRPPDIENAVMVQLGNGFYCQVVLILIWSQSEPRLYSRTCSVFVHPPWSLRLLHMLTVVPFALWWEKALHTIIVLAAKNLRPFYRGVLSRECPLREAPLYTHVAMRSASIWLYFKATPPPCFSLFQKASPCLRYLMALQSNLLRQCLLHRHTTAKGGDGGTPHLPSITPVDLTVLQNMVLKLALQVFKGAYEVNICRILLASLTKYAGIRVAMSCEFSIKNRSLFLSPVFLLQLLKMQFNVLQVATIK